MRTRNALMCLACCIILQQSRAWASFGGRAAAAGGSWLSTGSPKGAADVNRRLHEMKQTNRDYVEEVQEAIDESRDITARMRDWSRKLSATLPTSLGALRSQVVPWAALGGHGRRFAHSQSFNCSSAPQHQHKALAVFRIDPQHNAVVTVSTTNVTRGGCPDCFRGVVATVYRDSWEWVVGSGDTLDEGSGVLSDNVLLEGGASYFVVLRWEDGAEEPNAGRSAAQAPQSLGPHTWSRLVDQFSGAEGDAQSFQLTVEYLSPLSSWAQVPPTVISPRGCDFASLGGVKRAEGSRRKRKRLAVPGLPFSARAAPQRGNSNRASLLMGGCGPESPMPIRSSGKDTWYSLRELPGTELAVSVRHTEDSFVHVLREGPRGSGLETLLCLSGRPGALETANVQIEPNATHYIVLDSSVPTHQGHLSYPAVDLQLPHPSQGGVTILLEDDGGELLMGSHGGVDQAEQMKVSELPFEGPPVSNKGAPNLSEPPEGCGHSRGGGDVWYRFEPEQDLDVDVEATADGGPGGEAYMLVLYALEGSTDGEAAEAVEHVACGSETDAPMNGQLGSRISGMQLQGGRTYFFVVDGYLPHSSGVHRLLVRRSGTSEQSGALHNTAGGGGEGSSSGSIRGRSPPQPLAVGATVARRKGSGCFGECGRRSLAAGSSGGRGEQGQGRRDEDPVEEEEVSAGLPAEVWMLTARNDSVVEFMQPVM